MHAMLCPTGDAVDAAAPCADGARLSPAAWRHAVPTLFVPGATLREIRGADARSLFELLTTNEVSRFISQPPATVEGFDVFIAWAQKKRAVGECLCIGVVPDGHDTAVGLLQIHMRPDQPAEWGFALGSPFWGTGLFQASAEAVLDFAFTQIGVGQLCARAQVGNHRGNGALRKLGAVREGLLPAAIDLSGCASDQYYWTLTPGDRPRRKIVWEGPSH